MIDHVYLFVTPIHAECIPRLIIALDRRYMQYVNTIYHRTGTLWASRYKSSLIQTEIYLLSCQRYLELNPCVPPWWSIPPTTAGPVVAIMPWGSQPYYLASHLLYRALGRDSKERQVAYRELFRV